VACGQKLIVEKFDGTVTAEIHQQELDLKEAIVVGLSTTRTLLARIEEKNCLACMSNDAIRLFKCMEERGLFRPDDAGVRLHILVPSPSANISRYLPLDGKAQTPVHLLMQCLLIAFHQYRGHSWNVNAAQYYPRQGGNGSKAKIEIDTHDNVTIEDAGGSFYI
jgi:hypothetical protein